LGEAGEVEVEVVAEAGEVASEEEEEVVLEAAAGMTFEEGGLQGVGRAGWEWSSSISRALLPRVGAGVRGEEEFEAEGTELGAKPGKEMSGGGRGRGVGVRPGGGRGVGVGRGAGGMTGGKQGTVRGRGAGVKIERGREDLAGMAEAAIVGMEIETETDGIEDDYELYDQSVV
jgi:hypothetical protein